MINRPRILISVSLFLALFVALINPISGLAKSADNAKRQGVVLVIGATGRSGPELLAALKAEGFSQIRALVRNKETARTKLDPTIDLVQGDVRDPASLDDAMKGVAFIVSALGTGAVRDPENTPEKVDFEGVRNIALAAKAARVSHYVQLSSLGVTNPNHPLNRFGRVMDWKLKGEEAIRRSGVPYTIVRPGGLMEGPGGATGIRVGQGDTIETGRITRADVARVCVKALVDPAAVGKTFEIVADESTQGVDWQTFFQKLKPDL